MTPPPRPLRRRAAPGSRRPCSRLRRALDDDRGAGGVLVLGLVGAAVALTVGLLVAFDGYAAAQRAAAAADAAALAAADVASGLLPGDPCDAAARTAEANGASVTACAWHGAEASVEILVVAGPFEIAESARAGPPHAAGGSGELVLPLAAPYVLTDAYGPRIAPTAGASSNHPAVDLVGGAGAPVYAIRAGRVESAGEGSLFIASPDGTRIGYLHMHAAELLVAVGDEVGAGAQLGVVGNAGPSTGAHLDLRIDVAASSDEAARALPTHPGVDADSPGARYIDPEDFFRMHGLELCPADWCGRT